MLNVIKITALKKVLKDALMIRRVTKTPVIGNDLLNSVLLAYKAKPISLKTMQGERFVIGKIEFDLFLTSSALEFTLIKNGNLTNVIPLSNNPIKHIDKILAKQNGVALEGKGNIYLVSDGKNTKIGATTYNPTKRLNELQVGNAKKLTLIGSYQVERRIATESMLHDTYQDQNIRGEWFSLSDNDIVDILSKRTESSVNGEYQVLTAKDVDRLSGSIKRFLDDKAIQMDISVNRHGNRMKTCDKYGAYFDIDNSVLAHVQCVSI